MKPNKSIDGLVPRSAKIPSTNFSNSKNLNQKPVEHKKSIKITEPKKPSTPKNTISVKKPISKAPIDDNSLEISILEEDFINTTVHEQPKKTQKKEQKLSSVTEDFIAPLKSFDPDGHKNTEPKPKQKTKAKKKPSKLRRTITIVILSIVLLLIFGIIGLVLWGNDIIAKITGGQGTVLDLLTFTEETYEPLKTDANGRTNILAYGTSGYNMEGDEGNGTHDGAQLTDSIMMISFDQNTGDIAMLSLPRDLKASPTCTSTSKINEVYWCNGGGGDVSIEEEAKAADALMTEVGSILGVDFQYFAHLNWGSLIQIVDTLGGITITLDEDIHDYYWTGAVFDAGVEYTINGEQALGLARARHGTTGGDFSRGSSQQKILIGIKDKVIEKDLSIPEIMSLASALGDNLRTNFSLNEIKTLAHYAESFDFDSIRQITLLDYSQNIHYMTTGTINGISYVFPSDGVGNYGAIQDYVAKNLSSDPRDYEEATILVLNATDTIGLASSEQTDLTEAGFTNITVDDAPEGEYNTGTTLYALTSKPGTKALLETHYGLSANSIDDLPASLPQNYDFIIILNPEAEE